jgi:putative acetyltransferase
MHAFTLRLATAEDCADIRRLFRDTIRTVNARDYDAAQVAVWSSSAELVDRWLDRIARQHFLLAEHAGALAGFASLEGDYFDVLYVHHALQGQGVARMLAEAIEGEARRRGVTVLRSDVSITARPFFERRGFVVVCPQVVEREGVLLRNFKMEKVL